MTLQPKYVGSKPKRGGQMETSRAFWGEKNGDIDKEGRLGNYSSKLEVTDKKCRVQESWGTSGDHRTRSPSSAEDALKEGNKVKINWKWGIKKEGQGTK